VCEVVDAMEAVVQLHIFAVLVLCFLKTDPCREQSGKPSASTKNIVTLKGILG